MTPVSRNRSMSTDASQLPNPQVESQRFAAQISEDRDVPREFQDALDRLTATCGPYELGVLLVGTVPTSGPGNVTIAPRMVFLLRDHLAVLSFDAVSRRAATLLVERSRLLGYRMAGFLLDCRITLYCARSPQEIEIRFPVQSGELYWEFVIALFHWSCIRGQNASVTARHSVLPLNCPRPFTRFLHQHPESGEIHDCFLQTAVPFGKAFRHKCANLFVARTRTGVLILVDEEIPESSWLTVRISYFPLSSIRHVEWIDQFELQQGALSFYLGDAAHCLQLDWSLAMRFRAVAVHWAENLNSELGTGTAITGTYNA